jgi:hypothetical protein
MDHAIKSGIVTSFYTTYGIKGVESVFIRKMKDHDCDVDKLEQMIRGITSVKCDKNKPITKFK